MRKLRFFIPCTALIAPFLLHAQRASRYEISGVAQVLLIGGTDEGSLPLGGRVAYRLNNTIALEGQLTLGTTLGDGDDGDVIATIGAHASKRMGGSRFGLVARPGLLICSGNCSAVATQGSYFALYLGATFERPVVSRWFFRADVGNTLMALRGQPRDFGFDDAAPNGLSGNRTFGIGGGVRF